MSFAIAQDLSTYESALDTFEGIIRSESRFKRMPRQADPKVAPLLDNLTDARRHLMMEKYESDDFPKLLKNCTRANGILLEYALFTMNRDPGIKSAVAAGEDSREFADLIDRSFSSFQPEMGRLESFVVLCTARVITLADESPIKNAPAGRALDSYHKTIYYLRRSAYKIYMGTLRRMTNSSLPQDYRMRVAAALSTSAVRYSAIFTPEIRNEIARLCEQRSVDLSDELRPYVKEIVEQMSSNSCEGLCGYGKS
jgi:hypothetical protein